MIDFQLLTAPFTDDFVREFHQAANQVFGEASEQSLKWRLTHMPAPTVAVARQQGMIVGFKAGYAVSEKRYYSWLGGSVSQVRQQGVAWGLMRLQHEWLSDQLFNRVETHVKQDNAAMIALNQKAGLQQVGQFLKDGEPYLIMQKSV